MKKNHLIFVFFFLLAGFLVRGQNCEPGYGGFYYYKLDDQNSAVLRFFKNGEVIATTSTNKYKEVENYFTLERKDLMLHGKYKWKKCGSAFRVKGDTGEQHYRVQKEGEDLQVTIKDKATGKSTSRRYLFYTIEK